MNIIFDKKPTTASVLFIVLMWLFMIACAISFSGCSGKKGYQKYIRNHPEVLAKDCMENFPPIETFKPGRIDTIPGKIIEVPGDTVFVKGYTRDTIYITKTKYIQCPPSLICTPDTIIRVDSSAVYLLNGAKLKITEHEQTIKKLKSDKLWLTISGALLFLLTCLFAYLWIRKK
ncbi:hypothetical protein BCY91_14185 [Pelobium manganitolerans]|uniref:Uncharacterized protein n=1 Tax=Pelobium manganitolerans TaxID=1842495 RepID=A0A419S9W6_9SPHI|nr:hypothetical protein [Pelobium manganitolerans]RKD19022.1 hypothetical protein BCY91_14185 [Pelobium manganitolerans]